MLDARKSAILRKVVSEHIETGEPVGSQHVVSDEEIEVSAATVRSEMASLEREGYLTHPHTSAGRIPTDLGYRYFVDHLEGRGELDPVRAEQVSEFFTRAHGELSTLLRDTSKLLSALTHQAAVVVGPPHETLIVRSALVTRLTSTMAMVVVVLSNGVVDKQIFVVDEKTLDGDVEVANNVLRKHITGQVFSSISEADSSGSVAVDAIVQDSLRAISSQHGELGDSGEVFIGGAANMAQQFAAVETVREILSILEQSLVVVALLGEVIAKGNSVSIGAENEVKSLAECSLVVAPYRVGGEVIGTIGLLGPTRMNYPQALSAVAIVSQRLGQQLTGE
jgi:heat-inducible transcriptional repressor